MEPALDVPGPARARRVPGPPVPRRLDDGARREPARPLHPRPTRSRRGARAGARDHDRHSGQLHRQQAVVVPAPRLTAPAGLAALLTVIAFLLLAGKAGAATGTGPLGLPATPGTAAAPRLTEAKVVRTFLAVPKVADWLERYPPNPITDASFDRDSGTWTVHVWSGRAGEIARGVVVDADGSVREAWTGPQVAWKMARGQPGAFGGKTINSWPVWVVLSAVFLVGLADLRRPLSLRTLDLLVLLSLGVSLLFFNRGEVFQSAALAVPPLAYLLVRTGWIGFRGGTRGQSAYPRWPVWVLAGAALFLLGFRVGLNVQEKHKVIDVGYAGVIGADRILDGRAPYGAMPVEEALRPCGPEAA